LADQQPLAELDPEYSDAGATPTSWAEAQRELELAMAYWISTVRPDGRPHVTTIAGVWVDDAFHFTTGESERKARNLERNARCVVTTGCNVFNGLDVVVEGEAVRVTDRATLDRLADAYIAKYGDLFVFTPHDDGTFSVEGSTDPGFAFQVRATKAFGFAKGKTFGQTRWRF
jgi:pyridoxine/pyridoxamine 5'-phosphate oxidase